LLVPTALLLLLLLAILFSDALLTQLEQLVLANISELSLIKLALLDRY